MASCPDREQGDLSSLPQPSELRTQLLSPIVKYNLQREREKVIKEKHQFGQTKKAFLQVFTYFYNMWEGGLFVRLSGQDLSLYYS